jgi:hypothetical protein
MAGRIAEVLDRIEGRQEEPPLPEDVGALQLLQMAYRGEVKLSPQQMRAAIESLPYENPKLSAMAISSWSEHDFARRLDAAIERSEKAMVVRMIEGHVNKDAETGD